MLVHQILKSKGTSGVFSVSSDVTVAEAAADLSRHRIGTVIVSADGARPDGIVSERDIVRELAQHGAACLDTPVREIMTRRLISCMRSDTADDVLAQMTEGRFRHMPVLEAGEMVGLISLGDVVKAKMSELAMEKDALESLVMGH